MALRPVSSSLGAFGERSRWMPHSFGGKSREDLSNGNPRGSPLALATIVRITTPRRRRKGASGATIFPSQYARVFGDRGCKRRRRVNVGGLRIRRNARFWRIDGADESRGNRPRLLVLEYLGRPSQPERQKSWHAPAEDA